MLKILSSLAEEKLGYSYGKPVRIDEKSLAVVLPILRSTSISRQYITFPETEKVNVFDTGRIDEMEAHNTTDLNVFMRSGTIFKGSTQERALMRSAVLFPGKKQKLGVRCVHASRGISPNSKVLYGGITPLNFDKKNYTSGYHFADQSSTWSNVMASNAEMNAKMGKTKVEKSAAGHAFFSSGSHGAVRGRSGQSVGSYMMGGSDESCVPISASSVFAGPSKIDDLHSNFKEFAMHFDEILSKIKLVENQAGLAMINQNGVETIEVFDHKASWKALHDSAVKRLGSDVIGGDTESVFEYKPENAVKQVNRILALDYKTNQIFRHKPSNGEPDVEITGLTADGYVGEAVELNGSLIHLVILKQQ